MTNPALGVLICGGDWPTVQGGQPERCGGVGVRDFVQQRAHFLGSLKSHLAMEQSDGGRLYVRLVERPLTILGQGADDARIQSSGVFADDTAHGRLVGGCEQYITPAMESVHAALYLGTDFAHPPEGE